MELARTDHPCPYCGAPILVSYVEERVERYCTDCPGFYAEWTRPESTRDLADSDEYGYLGSLRLPPAGVKGRTASEVLSAAFTSCYHEFLSMGSDVCPRCSVDVDHSVDVCEDHDGESEACEHCGKRQAIQFESACPNCRFTVGSSLVMHLAADTELLAFVTAHGHNPISEEWVWGWEYDEEILSVEPFKAKLTVTVDDDAITLFVDDDLSVVDATSR